MAGVHVLDSMALGWQAVLMLSSPASPFFPHNLTQVALHSRAHTSFPPYWPWLIKPGASALPKLAGQKSFLRCWGKDRESISLFPGRFRSCCWPCFLHGDGRRRGGQSLERDEWGRLEENKEMREKVLILVPILAWFWCNPKTGL